MAEMPDWASRPLEAIYAAIFIDAIAVKVRDGQVANRPFYAAIGVTSLAGSDVLGLWAGHRWGGRQVLDERAHRPAQPRCAQTRSSWSTTASKACPRWSSTCGRRRWSRPHPSTMIERGKVPVITCTARVGPMQTRHPRGPDADPSLPVEAGSRSGQRELRFERRDEVPARPAVR